MALNVVHPVGIEVSQDIFFPRKLGMSFQIFRGLEIDPTRVSHRRREHHVRGHGGIGDLILHRPRRAERRLPGHPPRVESST